MKKITNLHKVDKTVSVFLNKNLYHTSFVRGSVLNKKKSLILDNTDFFFSSFSSNKVSFDNVAFSLNSKTLSLKSFLNKEINFSLTNAVFNSNKTVINCFNRILFCLSKLKIEDNSFKNKSFLLLLKPLKGGFNSLFNGVFGFIPLKSVKRLYYFFFYSLIFLLQKIKTEVLNSLFYKRFFLFRFYISSLKIFIYPLLKKKQFVKKFLKYSYSNKIQVVFYALNKKES